MTDDEIRVALLTHQREGQHLPHPEMELPRIFIFCEVTEFGIIGLALATDGTGLASHLCTDRKWVRHDMGLESDWKHDLYRQHYPLGYQLVDLTHLSPEETSVHPEVMRILKLNQQNGKPPL